MSDLLRRYEDLKARLEKSQVNYATLEGRKKEIQRRKEEVERQIREAGFSSPEHLQASLADLEVRLTELAEKISVELDNFDKALETVNEV